MKSSTSGQCWHVMLLRIMESRATLPLSGGASHRGMHVLKVLPRVLVSIISENP